MPGENYCYPVFIQTEAVFEEKDYLYVERTMLLNPQYAHSEDQVYSHLYHASFLVIYHVVVLLHVSLLVCRDYSG